jgi:hypothetical protein
VFDYASAKKADTARYGRFFHTMLEEGVYLPPEPVRGGLPVAVHQRARGGAHPPAARKAFRAVGPGRLSGARRPRAHRLRSPIPWCGASGMGGMGEVFLAREEGRAAPAW